VHEVAATNPYQKTRCLLSWLKVSLQSMFGLPRQGLWKGRPHKKCLPLEAFARRLYWPIWVFVRMWCQTSPNQQSDGKRIFFPHMGRQNLSSKYRWLTGKKPGFILKRINLSPQGKDLQNNHGKKSVTSKNKSTILGMFCRGEAQRVRHFC